ncbi:hypothetical protein [Amycolatopsis sp.]|uniref:hypothetical protein n=1 Tax=Amycolatopsis sp. TaxID=37632 RepID=UPI002C4FC272|nr:hypothetical protein [Amycolatopsis sp.]HVV09185.1 hypothetical protein [Amycolatopsis sp.]
MAYLILLDPQVHDQIGALPADSLPLLAEAIGVLELTPWNGPAYNEAKPDSPMRQLDFGQGRGLITYLVLDDQNRVDVLDVTWIG